MSHEPHFEILMHARSFPYWAEAGRARPCATFCCRVRVCTPPQVLILIFAEALGLYGLIVGLILASRASTVSA